MTADPRRRRRNVRVGLFSGIALVVVAIAATVVGVLTLRTSEAGEAVQVDSRPVVALPSTPTAALAVVDDQDRLTSLAVVTLLPAGGGSNIVTVPVNFDTSLGFGEERTPLSRRPVIADDADGVARFTVDVESALSMTIPFTAVLDEAAIAALVEPLAPLSAEFPVDVVESDAATDDDEAAGMLIEAGEREFDAEQAAAALTAIDGGISASLRHDLDVAVWQAIARAATERPLDAEVPLDDDDRPVDPASVEELLGRAMSGPVGSRDLAVNAEATASLPNPTEADFVVLDRFDALLVFAEIAPSLVSTPNESLTFQIIAPFSDDQVAVLGDEVTTELLVRQLITELVFAQGNVVSVQTAPSSEGAGETTLLEVADEAFLDDVREVAPVLFGEVEVVLAERLVEGTDVVAVLGTDFLDRRAEILAEQDDAVSDFTLVEDESVDESVDESAEEAPVASDTVDADE